MGGDAGFWKRFIKLVEYCEICGNIPQLRGCSAMLSATDAGKRLRAVRKLLRLSMREVEHLSREIALKKNAPDYFISRNWLGDIEAGKLKPNIYRLKSLSLIYRLGRDDVLSFFDVDSRDAAAEQALVGLPHTYLVTPTL